jgi:amino acid permease
MAVGGGTLAIAAIFKKGWAWWALGVVIFALALFFYWNKQNAQGLQSGKTNENS